MLQNPEITKNTKYQNNRDLRAIGKLLCFGSQIRVRVKHTPRRTCNLAKSGKGRILGQGGSCSWQVNTSSSPEGSTLDTDNLYHRYFPPGPGQEFDSHNLYHAARRYSHDRARHETGSRRVPD